MLFLFVNTSHVEQTAFSFHLKVCDVNSDEWIQYKISSTSLAS